MQFASANTHEWKWVLVIAHLILKVCNDHIFLIGHICAYALFLSYLKDLSRRLGGGID